MNGPIENSNARHAYEAIKKKYGEWFSINDSVGGFMKAMESKVGVGKVSVGHYVNFLDGKDFSSLLLKSHTRTPNNCRIAAFTTTRPGDAHDRVIYINRQAANASTLIHEMLHFLTHENFWIHIKNPAVVEAVTERFTRKVIGGADDKRFFPDQRDGRYDEQHKALTEIRQFAEVAKADNKPENYMKLAYFKGDDVSMGFIIKNFSMIQGAIDAGVVDALGDE